MESRDGPRSPVAQARFDANGTLVRGQSARGIWDDLDRLVEFCREKRLDRLAMALESYEDERKRQKTAIENLESQLMVLADKHREAVGAHGQLVGILRRAGMDMETLIRTDEIFGDGNST